MTMLSDLIASFVTKRLDLSPKASNSSVPVSSPLEQKSEPQNGGQAVSNGGDAIVITPEFEHAFSLIESRAPFIFITGRAGTGKSTFTTLLKERLRSYAVVAPTGVAALNVGGQTIHSFFRFAPGPIDLDKIKPVKNKIAYKALKTLVIDEISMVRADLLDAIDRFLRENGPSSSKPFGGVQVIAIGDLFQLPPIVATHEEQAFLSRGYKSPFFFSANCLMELTLQSIEFSKVFRQTEANFINLLNSIREGKQLSATLAGLNERVTGEYGDKFDGILLAGTNAAVSQINKRRLSEIAEPEFEYKGEIIGEFKIDQSKLPAPLDLQLKRGAQVMFLKNDRAKRWVNGTLGVVVECGVGFVTVALSDRFGRSEVRVEPELWDNFKFEYNPDLGAVAATKIGSYMQIPLIPAWAITVHKAQGKTFDRIHVDFGHGAFAEGQVYVALSRCRTLAGVTLQQPISKEDIHLNYDVIQFYASLGR